MFLPALNLSSVALLKKLDLVTALAIMAPHNRDVAFAGKLHEQLQQQLRKLLRKLLRKKTMPAPALKKMLNPCRPIIAR
jgi:hypothetical protein